MTLPEAPLAECGAPGTGRAVTLRASDGVTLRAAHWPAKGTDRHVMILPGRTEYIEKYGLVVRDLAARGWGALVIDWRGQGLSDRLAPDPLLGHVGAFADYQRDLKAFQDFADTVAPGAKPWLVHSMGGCIGLRGLVGGPVGGITPPAVAFSAPMLGLNQPPPLTTLIRMLAGVARPLGQDKRYAPTTGPDFGLPGMTFESNNLTTDRAQFDRMKAQIAEDPRLSLGGPSLRWMAQALAEMEALAAQPSPSIPALFALGGDETIVSKPAVRDRCARWPGADMAEYPQARHELTMERPDVRDDLLSRILTLFERHT